ncbi:MAG TPA: cob(I)yrinic acid a,c-diamide adenosyltransferase [Actinomycetota bacterium]|nr:cob(I)yrinic acid a,c-diamide adenosyltransferase [Actinomycetota bacterium]
MRIYTRRGDDGTTGLLYGGRVDKSDQRTEAYGTTDEAVAALGMARVFIADSILADLVLRLQRELFVAGAELATATENSHKLTPGDTKVTADMVDGLEEAIDEYVARTRMPEEFIVPGESRGSAFLDYARTVIRRAERQTVAMDRAGMLADGGGENQGGNQVVRYLNRLADLVFVLARYEEGDFRTLRTG